MSFKAAAEAFLASIRAQAAGCAIYEHAQALRCLGPHPRAKMRARPALYRSRRATWAQRAAAHMEAALLYADVAAG